MQVGLIGVGVVGGTLKKWFETHTNHTLKLLDPAKGMNDSLVGCEAIFISVPVPADSDGQDLSLLKEAVSTAKRYSENVFIRSTVLPGTCDELGCIAMPEFLTERRAFEDMNNLPIIIGEGVSFEFARELFPNKKVLFLKNVEAELAKFTHNCFGAMKVTYFNLINYLCARYNADFQQVKNGASITGFIEKEHTSVPGPDGLFGYGGKCFPENIAAMKGFIKSPLEKSFFECIDKLNAKYRFPQIKEETNEEVTFIDYAI